MLSRCRSYRRNIATATAFGRGLHRQHATTTSRPSNAKKTRNIGIIAHIDAGKTTTTERMLYYAGFTRQLGDVDEGNTITDFLPAERARGITIQSAAITFQWPPTIENGNNTRAPNDAGPLSSEPHTINLIDTPGHADFTFEVIRSLRVLDGAVCILDGVAGVEAQTEKVWSQASAYEIPKIVFVNKLDRDGAAFAVAVQEVGARLHVWPAVFTMPWLTDDVSLKGIGDVVSLRALEYSAGSDGKDIRMHSLSQLGLSDTKFHQELKDARTALVELIAEHDDNMVASFLEVDGDHMAVQPQQIRDSLRCCTLHSPQVVVPVFAGASFRNIGVQPLLDGIIDLLPSSLDRPDPEVSFGSTRGKTGLATFLAGDVDGETPQPTLSTKVLTKARTLDLAAIEACALAFKVVTDARRGVLVYVRVYSGTIRRNALLWNTNLQLSERAQRLLRMYANDAVDIDEIDAGQIGVIPALKHARTGDSLVAYRNAHPKHGPPEPVSQLQLRLIDVPPPVFFVSVEPNSLSEERHVKDSLELLLREDPSLSVAVDEESGQTHLAGMGELHLEIARDRLIKDLKAKARIGCIEISYREAISASSDPAAATYEREVGGRVSKASCTATVQPGPETRIVSDEVIELPDQNQLVLHVATTETSDKNDSDHFQQQHDSISSSALRQAVQNGVLSALARGPTYGYPMHSTQITIDLDPTKDFFSSTTPSSISSAVRLAVAKALKNSAANMPVVLMEPVMRVAISVDEASMGGVVQDIASARGGSVISLDDVNNATEQIQDTTNVDLKRIYVPPDPFGNLGSRHAGGLDNGALRTIIARVPLKEMVGYLKHLRSFTAGRGTFTMTVDRFEKMSSQRMNAMLGAAQEDSY